MSRATMERGEQVEVPDLRPVVSVETLDGEPHTLYGLQPQQNKAYCLTPLERGPTEHYPRHIGYGGAAGGGKSFLARAVGTAACLKWPGCTVLILRRTLDEVKQNHVNKFREEVPSKLPDGRRLYQWNGSDLCATFTNGSRLYFGYLRDSKDRERYSGNEYDVIIFEESTHYAWEDVRWLTGNRLRSTQDYSRPFALYPSNPGRQGHQWYKRLFIERDYDESLNEHAEDYAFVQAKVEHNYVLRKRDPQYIAELETMPEPYRSWLRDGDWSAGVGLALTMLDKDRHLVEPFQVPNWWVKFGSFDWGYAHPWSFGAYAVNEDGRVYKVCTITGRHQQPPEIVNTIRQALPRYGLDVADFKYIVADKICFDRDESRSDATPVIAQEFSRSGMFLGHANQDRIHGLNLLRKYLSYTVDGNPDGPPMLAFFDNDGNRRCFQQLSAMPTDPDNPEDALKQNADQFGHGGDDMYDETRYAMASRPPPPPSGFTEGEPDAWSKEALEYEREQQRKSRVPRSMRRRENPGQNGPIHPEFGGIY